jgi:hypothetical protein
MSCLIESLASQTPEFNLKKYASSQNSIVLYRWHALQIIANFILCNPLVHLLDLLICSEVSSFSYPPISPNKNHVWLDIWDHVTNGFKSHNFEVTFMKGQFWNRIFQQPTCLCDWQLDYPSSPWTLYSGQWWPPVLLTRVFPKFLSIAELFSLVPRKSDGHRQYWFYKVLQKRNEKESGNWFVPMLRNSMIGYPVHGFVPNEKDIRTAMVLPRACQVVKIRLAGDGVLRVCIDHVIHGSMVLWQGSWIMVVVQRKQGVFRISCWDDDLLTWKKSHFQRKF